MKLKSLFTIGFVISLLFFCLLFESDDGIFVVIYKQSIYLKRFFDFQWKTNNLNLDDNVSKSHCPETNNRSLYILHRLREGRTGSTLFQINCLLALANKFCYKAMIDPRCTPFRQSVQPFFDTANIELYQTVNRTTFQPLSKVLSDGTHKKLSLHLNNWTLNDPCYGYDYIFGQEQYIRSSIKFKDDIIRVVEEYMSTFFANRSTVAVHVRRTDRVNYTYSDPYQYKSLDWYIPYISNAICYLKRRHSDLAFIFCSDDIEWCVTHFRGEGVYFSPFVSAGYDLALIAHCDHMIFTLGGFAWHGAWLGKKKTVIYSKNYLPLRYTKQAFVYPWWTGL